MVVTDISKAKEITLRQLAERNPQYINYLIDALELLVYENELLRKIASRYSHDLRSPVTNIDMLLQLYEKAGENPDKDLYINKMIKSIKRLQEGFEALSAERKRLLVQQEGLSLTYLDEVFKTVKSKLPKNISIVADFSEGKKVKCNAKTLIESLVLLFEPFVESNDKYRINVNTEKSWNGLTLNIQFPDFLNLLNNQEKEGEDGDSKNKAYGNRVLGWNYYFAVLFLRTAGANVLVEEDPDERTRVQISFTQ
jgi:signal transduction histidine kinase